MDDSSALPNTTLNDQLDKINKEMYERNVELAIRNRTLLALRRMYEVANTSHGIEETTQQLAQTIVEEVHFKKVYIALVEDNKKFLRAVAGYPLHLFDEEIKNKIGQEFKNIRISLDAKENFCVRCVLDKNRRLTNSYLDILTPLVSEKQADEIQTKLGIQTCILYPILFGEECMGVLIVGMDKHIGDLSRAERETMKELTEVVGLTIKNAQLFSSLKSTTDKLEQANIRLKELDLVKDEFVSIASHELRTPMTTIKSYLWMVLNKNMQPLDEKVHTYLFRAYDSTERLIRLVSDMLTVSRIEGKRLEIKPVNFDIYELAKKLYEEIKIKAIEKNITFTLTPYTEPLMVYGDPDKIAEVIMNLVGNALKFSQFDGSVTITFRALDGMGQVSIADTSIGISKEDQAKLFQKFSRIAHSYTRMTETSGTGLGLYICKQIVSLHNGKIWVDSEVGKGSTFSFCIPLMKGE